MSAFREAVWASVAPGTQPEAFAARREWLLARVGPGERVLDVGCGDGAFAEALAGAGASVVALDVAGEAVRRARERAPAADVRLAGEDAPLPVAPGEFDAAWLGEVLEHVVDGAGLLAEVRLALRPGGRLLATTPAHGPLLTRTARLDPRADHLRFFTRRSLRALLEGFADVDVRRRRGRLWACASR